MELSDALFGQLAGWEAVKRARGLISADKVIEANWEPPLLRGIVQEGSATYRAGLVIHSSSDAENLCPCRDSRQRGLICAHSVAIGLQYLKSRNGAGPPKSGSVVEATVKPTRQPGRKSLLRAASGESGEKLEIFLILPPNFGESVARGKTMLYLEGQSRNGRVPLSSLPSGTRFVLNQQDTELLEALESLNEGQTPAMLLLKPEQFVELLPKLIGHPNVSLGKSQPLEILNTPEKLKLQAKLEPNGEIVIRLVNHPGGGAAKTSSDLKLGTLLRGSTLWVFREKRIQPLGLTPQRNHA